MNLHRFDFRYSPYQAAANGGLLTPANVAVAASVRDKVTILHEFGHALGLLHEHQNPALGCRKEVRWEGPRNVYQIYGAPPNDWDEDTVNRNLGPIARADPDAVQGTSDRSSVMIYSQPASIFINGASSRC